MTFSVANPIYDSVFKFLMEDERIAKTILSALLKKEVLSVEMRRHEHPNTTRDKISMFRIDFAAKVREKDGTAHLILIELQKTWLDTETLRFRRYLAAQYNAEENMQTEGDGKGYALPMVAIYLLGYRIGDIDKAVVYVNHKALDYEGQEVANGDTDPFINSLIHDSIIVQIPLLHGKINNKLDKVLSVFDQTLRDKNNQQILNIDMANYEGDDDMMHILRRLGMASMSAEVRQEMNDEDEYISVLEPLKNKYMRNLPHYDYLIVGSGLFGSTFAYMAKQRGKKCLVIDKRPHLGGNVYCENVEGINVHKYGAHIFHTSDKEVWDFVNSIVPFNRYTNSPVANYKGKLYNLPFNMNTFYQMWGVTTPEEAKAKIEKQRAGALSEMQMLGIREPRNLEEQAQVLIGKDIYECLIKGYTEKQWGRKCTELPPFIIKRLPVRFVFDNNYFNDSYQGIPIGGYNKLIEGLLRDVDVMVNTDFFENREEWMSVADKIVYTGKVDEYYDYRYGKLNYRTVRFEQEVKDIPNYQGNAVVNYTERSVPYTRIIEHKHFEMFGQRVYDVPKTVISKEYSCEWQEGMEPYYPINDDRNNILAEKYRTLTLQEENVIFGGRLAEYRYYDMAPIVRRVLDLFVKNSTQSY